MQTRQPIFNVPSIVVGIIGIFVAVHVARWFLEAEMGLRVLALLAFIPARYSGMQGLPGGDVASLTSFVTHMAVHGDIAHLMFNSAWFLAFGGAIALRVGSLRFLAFTLFTGICGALLFLAFNWGQPVPMVGASGAVSGMMAAVLRFLFPAMDLGRLPALREAPHTVPLLSLSETLSDRRILAIIGIWLLLNLLSDFGLFGPGEAGTIAWEAHIGGFAAGLLSFGLFDTWKRPPPRPYLVQ